MNWTSNRPWLGTVVRLGIGAVFLWAGWAKLANPRTFVRAVRAYDATPEWLSSGIGYGLPVLEICIAVLLIVGLVTRYAAGVAGALLAVFVIGIIEAGARGIKLECGCFGGGGSSTHTTYLLDTARDLGLIAMAVYLVLWPITRISGDEFLARNDHVELPSAKRMRTSQGQRKYNVMVETRRREALLRNRYLVTALAILVVLISVIGIGVQANRAKITIATTAANASATNGIVVGQKAPVTIDLYEDFQCPVCQEFQASAGSDIDSLISSGKAQVRFHMVAFLDSSSSGNEYSTRAANAGICASDISTATFLKFHDYLYGTDAKGNKIQPAEGGDGRTDDDIDNYAKAIGITGEQLTTFEGCVTAKTYVSVVAATTDNWSKRGYNGTPTLVVNGKQLADATKAALDKAVSGILATAPPVTPPKTTASSTDSSSASSSSSSSASSSSSDSASSSPSATP